MHEDEIFYITEGEYRFIVGNEEIRAKAGSTVFLPGNMSDSWIQLTQRGRQLSRLQPTGIFTGAASTCKTTNRRGTASHTFKTCDELFGTALDNIAPMSADEQKKNITLNKRKRAKKCFQAILISSL